MSKWNGKLKCVNNSGYKKHLTIGKEYKVINGRYYYDSGGSSEKYENYKEFISINPSMKEKLIEVTPITNHKTPVKQPDWNIEQSKLAKYIMINDEVTIAIPIDTPMGISFKHPDDEYDEEIGQALALKRLYENMAE